MLSLVILMHYLFVLLRFLSLDSIHKNLYNANNSRIILDIFLSFEISYLKRHFFFIFVISFPPEYYNCLTENYVKSIYTQHISFWYMTSDSTQLSPNMIGPWRRRSLLLLSNIKFTSHYSHRFCYLLNLTEGTAGLFKNLRY